MGDVALRPFRIRTSRMLLSDLFFFFARIQKKKKKSNTNFLARERTDKTVEGISWLPGPIAMMDLKRRRRPNSFFNGKKKNWSAKKKKIKSMSTAIPNKGGLCRSFSRRLYFFFVYFMAARLRLCSGNTKTLKIPHTTNSCAALLTDAQSSFYTRWRRVSHIETFQTFFFFFCSVKDKTNQNFRSFLLFILLGELYSFSYLNNFLILEK